MSEKREGEIPMLNEDYEAWKNWIEIQMSECGIDDESLEKIEKDGKTLSVKIRAKITGLMMKSVPAVEKKNIKLNMNIKEYLKYAEETYGLFVSKANIFMEFINLKYDESKCPTLFVDKIKNLAISLKGTIYEVSTPHIVARIVTGLPGIYRRVINCMDAINYENSQASIITKINSLLKIEYELLNDKKAIMEKKIVERIGHKEIGLFGKAMIKCHFCKKVGHIKKNCFAFKKKIKKEKESTKSNAL